MTEARLYLAQRVSAAILAPLILVHIVVIIHAVGDGLSAAEILGRTRGSAEWALFYGIFVLAAAIHAPIGLRTIAREWLTWRSSGLDLVLLALAVLLAGLGLRAVWAVTGPGP